MNQINEIALFFVNDTQLMKKFQPRWRFNKTSTPGAIEKPLPVVLVFTFVNQSYLVFKYGCGNHICQLIQLFQLISLEA